MLKKFVRQISHVLKTNAGIWTKSYENAIPISQVEQEEKLLNYRYIQPFAGWVLAPIMYILSD